MSNILLNYIHDAVQYQDTDTLQSQLHQLEKGCNSIKTALDSQICNRKRILEQNMEETKERIASLEKALTLLSSLPLQSYNLYNGFLQTVHMNICNDIEEQTSCLDDLKEEYNAMNKGTESLLQYYLQQISLIQSKISSIQEDNELAEQMEHYFEELINSIS